MSGDISTVSSNWGQQVIGYAVSSLMYGVTLGQAICYAYWFPNDPWFMKALVCVVWLADTGHVIGSTRLFWESLILCHQNHSWSCTNVTSWGGTVSVWSYSNLIFIVECFYCRRIWTITGNNKPITLVVFVLATLGYACSIWYSISVTRIGTMKYMFASPLILPFSSVTTLCDFVITFSVFKFMWNSGFRRRRTIIQDLALVCIATGASTCLLTLITGIVFLVQGDHYWVSGMAFMIGRSYAISMLTVLNARKNIRDRNVDALELPTIRATLVNSPSHPMSLHELGSTPEYIDGNQIP